jgi:hypothetical protein
MRILLRRSSMSSCRASSPRAVVEPFARARPSSTRRTSTRCRSAPYVEFCWVCSARSAGLLPVWVPHGRLRARRQAGLWRRSPTPSPMARFEECQPDVWRRSATVLSRS